MLEVNTTLPVVPSAASPPLAVISVLEDFLAALIASATFLAVATPSVAGPVIVPSAPAVIVSVLTSYLTTPASSILAVVILPFLKFNPSAKDTCFAVPSFAL